MDCIRITGGARLQGSATISGAKNAALPIMAASILAGEPVRLLGVPKLVDVDTLSLVLGHLGVEVKRALDDTLRIETVDPSRHRADYGLVRRMRASFCVLGPLLARRGRAVVSLPGGCNIGTRPVDLHLAGLAALGADLQIKHGYVVARARKLRGAVINLRGPAGPTVTGTANVMAAATLAEGETILRGAAAEPEVVDLGQFLISLGARIEGLGGHSIRIVGVRELCGSTYRIIPDRIEAATLLIAAAITRGSATLCPIVPEHLQAIVSLLEQSGAAIEIGGDWISIHAPARPRPLDATAAPYPGVPSDVQAQLMALLALADGRSEIRDAVFPDRFMHVPELNRLGAHIERCGGQALIQGVSHLSGANVMACDLRASAALVLAGLAACGKTAVRRIYHLDRGYERLEEKLNRLGADIFRERDETPHSQDVAIARL